MEKGPTKILHLIRWCGGRGVNVEESGDGVESKWRSDLVMIQWWEMSENFDKTLQ